MWILFGTVAIIAAILNIIWTIRHRDAKWFRYISLSFTILTLCAEYSLVNKWLLSGDLSALTDVVPTMSNALWFLSIVSILINGISLFLKKNK